MPHLKRMLFLIALAGMFSCQKKLVPAIGAEKLASGDPKAVRAANKAPKFKADKYF